MRIDEEELKRRLKSPNNLSNLLGIPDPCSENEQQADLSTPDSSNKITHESAKRSYTQGIDNNTRILAGILASQQTSTSVARELGITRNQAFHAARTSQEKVAVPRDTSLGRVQELALEKTLNALGLMTPEKFENASLKDLSAVAANMSRVIEKTSPHTNSTQIELVIYSPEQKKESHYKVIDV